MLMKFVFQINDGDEYWGLRHLVNAAEQAEEFAIAIWHKLQSWKVKNLDKISLFFSQHIILEAIIHGSDKLGCWSEFEKYTGVSLSGHFSPITSTIDI